MFRTAIAGSLPKPAWLAETHKLWPKWRQEGAELARAQRDATLLWLKIQEDAGIECGRFTGGLRCDIERRASGAHEVGPPRIEANASHEVDTTCCRMVPLRPSNDSSGVSQKTKAADICPRPGIAFPLG